MGVLTKYGFGLYREIKEIRQKNDGGLTKYGFGQYKEIKGTEKKDGGLTKYGFGSCKKMKGFGAKKSWGLNKVWICWRRKK